MSLQSPAPEHPSEVAPPPATRPSRGVDATTVWGLILLAVGGLLLLDRLAVVDRDALLWGPAFAVGAVAFALVVRSGPQGWWGAIPAGVLLGLAAAVVLEDVEPPVGDADLAGAAFLALAGAGFLTVHLRDHRRWWALIPGGVLVTLALVALVEGAVGEGTGGAVLLLGLGLTFALLAVVPTGRPTAAAGAAGPARMRWPLVPAVVLLLLSFVVALGTLVDESLAGVVWPALLAAAGVVLLTLSVRRARRDATRPPTDPAGRAG
ncbi:hypothetical protein [Actinotalea solisilvae]|uniref:hypothetical protein n=1 Tax=Actinotalea solisilvae TaxID=2072922 RepID=UPI0018F17EF0|nr:hypothetical protein [Actinotalea solisilvae]